MTKLADLGLVIVDSPKKGPHTNIKAAYDAARGISPQGQSPLGAVWIPASYPGTDPIPANPVVPIYDQRNGSSYGTAYSIAGYVPSVYTNNQVLVRIPLPVGAVFPASLTGSAAVLETAATAQTIFSIQKNGVGFGTITFAAAGTVGTFASISGATFMAGDILSIVAPATADSTAAGLGFFLTGTRG